MKINAAVRADANRLLDLLLATHDEESALAALAAADVENLPVVAAAALVILAAGSTEITKGSAS